MRSKLFVPGSRPELFSKALDSAADALSFDLEDAVVPARKAEARAAVRGLLESASARSCGKTIIVRVNPVGSAQFDADIAAVVRPGLACINLPKAESADSVAAAADAIARAERENGVDQPVGLLVNIESPRALRHAAALAAAHGRVIGLQLGLADLFEPSGIGRYEQGNVRQAMFAVRMAAAEAGVFACDAAFADIENIDGFRAEAGMARRMGFVGKTCIHPRQVAPANEIFQPTGAEIARALKVVAAARAAADKGDGACKVDGEMIDAPFVSRAHAILARAQQFGLMPYKG